jgi:hypothetical protein
MKRPPVEGLPTPRPTCVWCHKPLKFWTDDTHQRGSDLSASQGNPVVRRQFRRWDGYGRRRDDVPRFDRLQCALEFAVAAEAAGYRRAE